jgi:hypothetical protein
MDHPVLRLFDGSEGTSPELRNEAKELQRLLKRDGFATNLDGTFGRVRESAVRLFQNEHTLAGDGIVGPVTWSVLIGTEPPDPRKIIFTSFPPDNPSVLAQLNEATKYKRLVNAACNSEGFQAALIGDIGSPESHWGLALKPVGPNGTGDFAAVRFPTEFRDGPMLADGGGFGQGLMQIDFDAQESAGTGAW